VSWELGVPARSTICSRRRPRSNRGQLKDADRPANGPPGAIESIGERCGAAINCEVAGGDWTEGLQMRATPSARARGAHRNGTPLLATVERSGDAAGRPSNWERGTRGHDAPGGIFDGGVAGTSMLLRLKRPARTPGNGAVHERRRSPLRTCSGSWLLHRTRQGSMPERRFVPQIGSDGP